MTKNYQSYASYFVSYLLKNFKEINNIERIILFGSVAKMEANKDSDIDLFIEVQKNNKKFEKNIERFLKSFYKSREALVFKNKGVDNKINILVGKLKDWEELEKSIGSTGIVFYGRIGSSSVKGKKYSLFFWDKVEKNRGAFLNKLYGFKTKNKRYSGLIENLNGKKLGKSCMIIPVEHRKKITDLIKHYRVNAKIIEIYFEEFR